LFLCLYFPDWDVQRVNAWAKALFDDEEIARKFEEEEIEGGGGNIAVRAHSVQFGNEQPWTDYQQ